jgi:PhnB protein
VFGWSTDPARGAFTDATGHVIGHFVADLPPSREGGFVPYVYVASVAGALERAVASGGEVVRPRYVEGDLWVATLRDPAGNVVGAWQSIGTVKTSLSPWLSVVDGAAALAFYRAAFGAAIEERQDDAAGRPVVARLAVDGVAFWIQEGGGGGSARNVLTMADPDAGVARAVAAGATLVAEAHEEHGWRVGRVVDPSGHHWELARELSGRETR